MDALDHELPADAESGAQAEGIPRFSAQEAVELTRELYGFEAQAEQLPSYIDQNFRLEHPSGRKMVLKIANSSVGRDELDLQNRVMDYVAEADPGLCVPRVISTLGGDRIVTVEGASGRRYYVRLLTFLEGIRWTEAPAPDSGRLHRLGNFVGSLTRALEGFSHPAQNHDHNWDGKHFPRLRDRLGELAGARRRGIVEEVLDRFDREVAPRLPWLPSSVIHNDVNENNVLVDADCGEISGLIDFGDLVQTVTA